MNETRQLRTKNLGPKVKKAQIQTPTAANVWFYFAQLLFMDLSGGVTFKVPFLKFRNIFQILSTNIETENQ